VNIPSWSPYNGFIGPDGGVCCFNRLMSNNGNGDVFLNVGGRSDTGCQWFADPDRTLVTLTVDNSGANAVANVYLGSAVSGNPVSFAKVADPSTLHTYIGSGEGGTTWDTSGQLADARIGVS
jgi:hypothetical protein